MPASSIGLLKSEVETPALCLDLDKFEANLRVLSQRVLSSGKQWRPHQKCPKTPPVAWEMQRAGASGVTVAKVSEAEVMAAAGITDILIAHLPVGERRLHRIAGLCAWARPIVSLDHFTQADALSRVCRKLGVTCDVIVDINIGMDRTGVRPGRDACELGQAIDKMTGLRLRGIMGYEGHLMPISDLDVKGPKVREALSLLSVVKSQYAEIGLCCDIVSAGGTGSAVFAVENPDVTEIQAGGGVFGDPFYSELCGQPGFEPALSVLATVVGRQTRERAILDLGRKAVSQDFQLPKIKGLPDANLTKLSAEHGTVELGPESQSLKIGDHVDVIPFYGDFTTVLHDEFVVCRGHRVVAVWPILGRGKLQ
jgi:D-serine deaminase-like pyridoxal phosphate-dependent protein